MKLKLRSDEGEGRRPATDWYLVCLNPEWGLKLEGFPLVAGRGESCDVVLADPKVGRQQFKLEKNPSGELVVSDLGGGTNPTYWDGDVMRGPAVVTVDEPHLIVAGRTILGLAQNVQQAIEFVNLNAGILDEPDEVESETSGNSVGSEDTGGGRILYSEEVDPVEGESFRCPYCRAVVPMEDVLSVSVSPSLLGDPILGETEQRRFLPSRFTGTGLALDAAGGVCTEIACPRCHMSLPQVLIEMPQIVMSVVGAAGAGKSVFLASCIWECRQKLSRLFGIGFRDLDPVANRWINAYEEKLFFQENGEAFQQIEKTDLQASNVCRSVVLDGDSVLLPLPSFFLLKKDEGKPQSLVVYDSAGEHFRAGADLQSSAVTLNMLNADVLFFMFDPSADPRFRSRLNRGGGTAQNYAQRQDVLLAEMSARILRHLGNRGERKLTRPLVFGVSKADLLSQSLPLEMSLYQDRGSRHFALDVAALRRLSEATERLLAEVVPEVVETAHDIAENVWFIPVSALGHNPMREGVRPCDIKPFWAELPIVLTLAKRGLIETVNGSF